MKAFITLCTVLTVSLVLNVSIDGVQSANIAQSRDKPAVSMTSKTSTTTRSLAKKVKPSADAVGTAEADTVDVTADTTDAETVKMARPKNAIDDNDKNNNNNNNGGGGGGEDDAPLPTNVLGASRRLVRSVGEAANRRGTDVLNAGTGLVRMGTELGNLLSSSVARQSKNVRMVTTEGFGMANGFGDNLTRGAVKVMRAKSEVGRDMAGRVSDVTDAAVEKGKKSSRFVGTIAKTPFKVGSDMADVGTSTATIPINLSKWASRYMTGTALPRVGADKLPEDEGDVNVESV